MRSNFSYPDGTLCLILDQNRLMVDASRAKVLIDGGLPHIPLSFETRNPNRGKAPSSVSVYEITYPDGRVMLVENILHWIRLTYPDRSVTWVHRHIVRQKTFLNLTFRLLGTKVLGSPNPKHKRRRQSQHTENDFS